MKQILVLSVFVSLFLGCSIKKKGELGEEIPISKVDNLSLNTVDSDGDGLEDYLETQNGQDPNLSNYPRVNIFKSNSIQIKTMNNREILTDEGVQLFDLENVAENKVKQAQIISQIDSIFYNLIKKSGQELIINDEHLSTFVISDWNKDKLYVSKKILETQRDSTTVISTKIQIYLDHLKGVKSISNINLSLGFYNPITFEFSEISSFILRNDKGENVQFNFEAELSNYLSVDYYNIVNSWPSGGEVLNNLENGSEIAIMVKNFDYDFYGKKLNYADTLSKVNGTTSKVIVSDSNSIYSLNIVNQKIDKVLTGLGYQNLEISNDQITGLGTGEKSLTNNTDVYNYDYSRLSFDDYNLGSWARFPETLKISNELITGDTYILHYAKVRNLFESVKTVQEISTFDIARGGEFSLPNVKVGDEITLEVDVSLISPKYNVINVSIPVSYREEKSEPDCLIGLRGRDFEPTRCYRTTYWKTYHNSCLASYKSIGEQVSFPSLSLSGGSIHKLRIETIGESGSSSLSLKSTGKYKTYISGNKAVIFFKVTPEYFKSSKNLKLVLSGIDFGHRPMPYGANGWVSCPYIGKNSFSCNHGTYCRGFSSNVHDTSILKAKITRVGAKI